MTLWLKNAGSYISQEAQEGNKQVNLLLTVLFLVIVQDVKV